MKIISKFLALLVFVLFTQNLTGQDFYGFQEILKGPTYKRGKEFKPNKLKADLKGGILLMTMADTAEKKQSDYEFRWRFIDDISKLQSGKKYKFEMIGRRVLGNADKNTNTAWMMSSNQGSKLAKKAGIESLANIVSITKSQSNVVAWPIKPNNKCNGTIEVAKNLSKEKTYFTFKFDFSSHPYASNSKACSFEVVYVYRKNAAPAIIQKK